MQTVFGFTFLVLAHPGIPGQNPKSRKMVVVVVVVSRKHNNNTDKPKIRNATKPKFTKKT